MTEMITITMKEYKRLKDDSDFLSCLEAYGVDNWECYDDAIQMFNEEDEA